MGEGSQGEDLRKFFLEDYAQSRQDWRYLDSFIWQIPSVCVVIVGALLGIAYYAVSDLWVRALLVLASITLTSSLVFAMVRHNQIQLAIQERIEFITTALTGMRFKKRTRLSSFSLLAGAMIITLAMLSTLLLSIVVEILWD